MYMYVDPVNYQDIEKHMRKNVDILKEEITNHVNSEIERFRKEIDEIERKNGHKDKKESII